MAKYVKIGDYKCPLQSLCVPYEGGMAFMAFVWVPHG